MVLVRILTVIFLILLVQHALAKETSPPSAVAADDACEEETFVIHKRSPNLEDTFLYDDGEFGTLLPLDSKVDKIG